MNMSGKRNLDKQSCRNKLLLLLDKYSNIIQLKDGCDCMLRIKPIKHLKIIFAILENVIRQMDQFILQKIYMEIIFL